MLTGQNRLSLAALSLMCALTLGAAVTAEAILTSAPAAGIRRDASAPARQEGEGDNPFIQECEGHHSCGRPCEMCHWDNRGSKIVAAQQAAESEAGARAVADWLNQRSMRVWFRGEVQYAPRGGDVWIVSGRAISSTSVPAMLRHSSAAAPGQTLEVRGIRQSDGTISVRRAIACPPGAQVCFRPLPAANAAVTAPTDSAAGLAESESIGRSVFFKAGCNGCHTITGVSQGTVGPSLDRITEDAERFLQQDDYKASQGKATTAREYILESIVDPNTFIVPQCPYAPCTGHLKPENFEELLTRDELNAVVDFLISLGKTK